MSQANHDPSANREARFQAFIAATSLDFPTNAHGNYYHSVLAMRPLSPQQKGLLGLSCTLGAPIEYLWTILDAHFFRRKLERTRTVSGLEKVNAQMYHRIAQRGAQGRKSSESALLWCFGIWDVYDASTSPHPHLELGEIGTLRDQIQERVAAPPLSYRSMAVRACRLLSDIPPIVSLRREIRDEIRRCERLGHDQVCAVFPPTACAWVHWLATGGKRVEPVPGWSLADIQPLGKDLGSYLVFRPSHRGGASDDAY